MARQRSKELKITGPQIVVGAGSYGGAETKITVKGLPAVTTEASVEINGLAMAMHQDFTDKAFRILNSKLENEEDPETEEVDPDERIELGQDSLEEADEA